MATLDAVDTETVCAIARTALAAAVTGRRVEPEDPGRPALRERCGCFVTLKLDGNLRGCLGCFTAETPLYQTVAEYTYLSAREDPRFAGARLTPEDLTGVAIDISVLSPLRPCPDPEAIALGVDGIYVVSGGRTGCFLPQVATETGWTVEEFLGHCCRDKAGLDWDAWRRPDTTVMTFTADVFACPPAG
ncbi:MAG: AmmeMemoRadiSam system protein A [Planctomycetes bacterium]|nr:AmmeMemoRadiSam system protein A [Planctomycetota bacterium]